MKWAIKLIILSIAVTFVVTSCNQKKEYKTAKTISAKPAPSKIAIVGTWKGQGEREKILANFVRYYNFLNQESEATVTFSADIEEYNMSNENFLANQISKSVSDYDILLLNNCYYYELNGKADWAKEYLVDFSTISEFNNNTNPSLLNDSIKSLWHGIIPGPFVEGFSYTMWCNNNVAKKVGIDVKQIGMTYDDFLNYIIAVYNYNTAHPNDYIIPIMDGGADWKTLKNFFEQLYASALNNATLYFNDEVSEQKLDAWYTTLKKLEQLSTYEALSPNWASMPWTDAPKHLLNDKCLFYSNGSWFYNDLQAAENSENIKNIMPTEYPTFQPALTYPAGFQIPWGVPKNAPHKKEAINFLLTLNSSLFAEDWVRKTKSPTGIKGSVASVTIGLDQFENFIYQINKKYTNRTFVANGSETLFGKANRNNSNFAYNVLTGQLSAEEAMQKIREDLANNNVEIIQNN